MQRFGHILCIMCWLSHSVIISGSLLCSASIVSTEFKVFGEHEVMTIIIPEEIYLATLNFLGIPPLKGHHENLCGKELCFTPTRKLLIS